MNLQSLAAAPRALLTSDGKVFGLKYPEILFFGMMLVALGSGPLADLKDARELLHLHNIISGLATLGAVAVSFATGRMSADKGKA